MKNLEDQEVTRVRCGASVPAKRQVTGRRQCNGVLTVRVEPHTRNPTDKAGKTPDLTDISLGIDLGMHLKRLSTRDIRQEDLRDPAPPRSGQCQVQEYELPLPMLLVFLPHGILACRHEIFPGMDSLLDVVYVWAHRIIRSCRTLQPLQNNDPMLLQARMCFLTKYHHTI